MIGMAIGLGGRRPRRWKMGITTTRANGSKSISGRSSSTTTILAMVICIKAINGDGL